MSIKTVSVIGLGYIGLPTAAMFASKQINVIGVDVNQETVDIINRGEIHIVEPDLDIAVKNAVTNGYLKSVTRPEPADAFLIAVPTPFKGDHEPDLSYVKVACESIAPVLKVGDVVILESTSPVGATEKMTRWIAAQRPDLSFPDEVGGDSDIRIAHCPERVLPGQVMRELIENDRIIGGLSDQCSQAAVNLYQQFVKGQCVVTNARTAEMAKLTENSFRDVNIAFANELSVICDNLNINVWELIELSNRHPRVNILNPGPGVGGHCIAVDPWFIVSEAPNDARLIRTAREVNDSKPVWVFDKVKIAIAELLLENPSKTSADITIACYGLAFKADIDDLRESPALDIAKKIASHHPGEILLVEPNISALPTFFGNVDNVKLVENQQALDKADIHLGLVDHKSFKQLDINKLQCGKVIDTKGMWP